MMTTNGLHQSMERAEQKRYQAKLSEATKRYAHASGLPLLEQP